MNKLQLLVKTSRPAGWILGPLVFLFGIVVSGASLDFIGIVQIILLSFPGCILLYGINDVYDYESDKINPRKKLIEGIKLEKKNHPFIKKISYIMIGLLLLSSILTFNISNIVAMCVLVFIIYYYSAPPIRLKEKPPIDSISNGLIILAVAALGFSHGKSILFMPLKAYFMSLCIAAVHIYSTLTDYSSDKKVGDKTFAVKFGQRTTAIVATIIFVLSHFISDFQTPAIKYYVIGCMLIGMITIIKPTEKVAKEGFRVIFIGSIAAAIIYLLGAI